MQTGLVKAGGRREGRIQSEIKAEVGERFCKEVRGEQ